MHEADEQWTVNTIPIMFQKRQALVMDCTIDWKRVQMTVSDLEYYQLKQIQNWKLNDFQTWLCEKNVSFGVSEHYFLSRFETFKILMDWLNFQFGDNWKNVLLNFEKIFNRELNEINSICLIGPNNCGKTWFIKMWCMIARFVGRPTNFSFNSRFDFANCVSKRLLFFDQPKFPSLIQPSHNCCSPHPTQALNYMKTLKELACGLNVEENVKFQQSKIIEKTPMFLISDLNPFVNCVEQLDTFKQHMLFYELQIFPNFQNRTQSKFGNPLALFDVYEIIKLSTKSY